MLLYKPRAQHRMALYHSCQCAIEASQVDGRVEVDPKGNCGTGTAIPREHLPEAERPLHGG
jgi:hypothetical protein